MADNKEKMTIEIREDGPLIVNGVKTVRNSKGQKIEVKDKFALCRCGSSSNKPFCDGTHREIAFSGKREINKPINRERAYEGSKITVHDNRVICSHAEECVRNLNAVFDPDARPWIDPNAAEVARIVDTVNKCPSGALTYSVDQVHHQGEDRDPAIDVARNGPYNVSGAIELKTAADLQPPVRNRYALCRCGASKNKPYCDGAHAEVDFVDDAN